MPVRLRRHNGRFVVDRLGHPGVETLGWLDAQIVIAQYVADQVIGIPDVPSIRRIEFVGAHGLLTVDPCRDSRSEEHTSELQSLMRISYAVFRLNKKTRYKQD